jgi:hypothetical protein
MVDGVVAQQIIRYAFVLLGLCVVGIFVILLQNKPVPAEITFIITSMIGALTGFIAGTRVITPDVAAETRMKPITDEEKAIIAAKGVTPK